jgi:hypothetical protein
MWLLVCFAFDSSIWYIPPKSKLMFCTLALEYNVIYSTFHNANMRVLHTHRMSDTSYICRKALTTLIANSLLISLVRIVYWPISAIEYWIFWKISKISFSRARRIVPRAIQGTIFFVDTQQKKTSIESGYIVHIWGGGALCTLLQLSKSW